VNPIDAKKTLEKLSYLESKAQLNVSKNRASAQQLLPELHRIDKLVCLSNNPLIYYSFSEPCWSSVELRKIPLVVSRNKLKHISSRIPIAFKSQQKSRPAENIA